MKLSEINPTVVLYGVAAGAALWFLMRPKDVAQSVARAGVGVVTGAASGVVVGIGEALGLPETNKPQCQRDMANGDKWAASFSCPAGDYLKFIFNGYNATN